jgi:hypothetical protein
MHGVQTIGLALEASPWGKIAITCDYFSNFLKSITVLLSFKPCAYQLQFGCLGGHSGIGPIS